MNADVLKTHGREIRWMAAALVLGLALSLAACSLPGSGGEPDTGGERVEQEAPDVLPTRAEGEDVGEEALAAATDDYDQTWDNYLRDIIAEQVADRSQKIEILQRYEDPDLLNQRAANEVQGIELIADRTVLSLQSNGITVIARGDFDLRYTYLNGDTKTVTCTQTVNLQQREADGLWYVINPGSLQIFSVCQ